MKYKIIIPQEEPKYTTSNLDNEKYKDYSVSKEEPKQETLEEAAIYNYKELYEGEPLTQDGPIDAFKQGAKWQQENSNVNALDFEIDSLKREIKVLKHQQERSYSEEDMRKAYCRGYGAIVRSSLNDCFYEWFEQFKKK
jgi:hypothetical protein